MATTTGTSPTQLLSPEKETESSQHDLTDTPSKDLDEKQNQVQEPEPTGTLSNEEPQWISGMQLWIMFSAITLVCFLMLLDTSIIVTAIPRITSDFHSLPDVGWYGSAYQLASAALQPLTGRIYMNFNTKWSFVCFFALFELGSLICGLANSSKMLIVGRAIAGMGTSGIQNGAMTMIASSVPMEKRPVLIGGMMGVAQLGLVLGPLIGGALTQYTSWRWCFYINLPVGAIVAPLLLLSTIPERVPKPPPLTVLRTLPSRLDLLGFAIFAAATIQLLLALQYGGNTFAWNSATVIGLFCGSGVTFFVWLAWDWHKGDDALIPLSMLRKRIVWSSCLVFGFFSSQMFCTSYYLPIYFQGVLGATPTMSGVYFLPTVLSQLFGIVGAGRLLGYLGYYLPFGVASGILLTLSGGLLSTISPDTSTGKWIGYQIIGGTGRGIGLQVPILAVQNSLLPSEIPIAMALLMFSQTFAGSLFLTFAATIFTNSLKTLIPEYAPEVDAQALITAGATGFRSLISGAELAHVLVAYAKSVDRVFYLITGAAFGCFAFAWAMGWKDIRKRKVVSAA